MDFILKASNKTLFSGETLDFSMKKKKEWMNV